MRKIAGFICSWFSVSLINIDDNFLVWVPLISAETVIS